MPGVELLYIAAIIAGLVQGLITLRWYRPPPKDGEVPTPVFEAVLYTVLFSVFFAVYAIGLVRLQSVRPPFGEAALVLLSVVGGFLLIAHITGRIAADRDPVERWLALMTVVTIAVFPGLVLLIR